MNHYKIVTLSNGFTYVTLKNNHISHCILLLLLGVGSVYENKEQSGISHFLEHIPFKGTKKWKNVNDLTYLLDTLGTDTNAFTDKETTGYHIKISKQYASQGLEILYDLVLRPTLEKKNIELERNVILEEYRKGLDEPEHIIDELLHQTIFKGHPLSNSVIGTKKTIETITSSDIQKYHKKNYLLSNMKLVIVGNYPNKIHTQIKKMFSQKYEPSPLKQTQFLYSSKKPTILFKKKDNLERTCISVSFPTISYNHPDRYILEMIGTYLGSGMSSRLFTELREKKSLVYNVFSDQYSYYKGGYFEIGTCLNHKNIEDSINIIIKELQKLKKNKIKKKELDKCYHLIKGNIQISSEDITSIAEFYAYQLLYAKKIINYKKLFHHFRKITQEDILRVANQYFVMDHVHIFIYGQTTKKTIERIHQMIKMLK
tara:strand:+ start:77 stop:1360 length:1284 start_codon:yes stop_codon:yes gene_type:complete